MNQKNIQENVVCIIPARMASTRFPGKPLAKILGKPMILHTIERATEANCFSSVICATDSNDIFNVVTEAGYHCELTPTDFRTGGDRVAWVADKVSAKYVVNLQGDEPLMAPELLQNMVNTLLDIKNGWVTAYCPLEKNELNQESVVKIWLSDDENRTPIRKVLGFGRNSIPPEEGSLPFHHVGVYGYTGTSLNLFRNKKVTVAEKELSLEQLRVWGEVEMAAVYTPEALLSVDVPSELDIVEKRMQNILQPELQL